MKELRMGLLLAALLVFTSISGSLGAQSTTGSSLESEHPAHRQAGFFDYALGKINPDGKDYGGNLRSARAAFVQNTIDDIYFWSNLISIVLLATITILYCLHLRSANKKEFIAAVLLTEFWNRAASDRMELEARTEQFNELSSRYSAEAQLALAKSELEPDDKRSTSKLQRTVDHVVEKPSKAVVVGEDNPSGIDMTVRSGMAMHDVTAVNLQERVVLLQKRIAEMKKVEQNLKEQVNRKDALLDQSERRNRTLKGA